MCHTESDHLVPIQNWFLSVHGAKLLPLEARTVHGDVRVPLCPHCLPTFGADTHTEHSLCTRQWLRGLSGHCSHQHSGGSCGIVWIFQMGRLRFRWACDLPCRGGAYTQSWELRCMCEARLNQLRGRTVGWATLRPASLLPGGCPLVWHR